jgi:hypothetical protein
VTLECTASRLDPCRFHWRANRGRQTPLAVAAQMRVGRIAETGGVVELPLFRDQYVQASPRAPFPVLRTHRPRASYVLRAAHHDTSPLMRIGSIGALGRRCSISEGGPRSSVQRPRNTRAGSPMSPRNPIT